MPPFNMRLRERDERLARQLKQRSDYRILYRLPRPDEVWCRSSPIPQLLSTTRIAVIDCETTGLNLESSKIIELAVVKMTIDDIVGDLIDISPPLSWLEDPQQPLTPEIEALTGLSDDDFARQVFDERVIAEAFHDVDVICAHNARFDASFVKKRFPNLAHPWACSLNEVDWAAHGLDGGRSVGALLNTAGHFAEHAHRAGSDAWSVAVLLAMTARDGRTIAAHLLERARKPTHKLYAGGAPFAVKDTLRAAGYCWCATRRAWSLEADPERIANEALWLKSLCPAILPRIERRDWYDRYTE
jgi:DNA polymerase III subunit epsilon